MSGKPTLVVLALLIALPALHAQEPKAGTWLQWRGPNRDGFSPGTDWPDRIAGNSLKVIWEFKELGESYSGPIVTADRVFTTETVNKKIERIRCLDRKTGKQIWAKEWQGSTTVPFFAARNGAWIRSTPACDSECIYVAGIRDVLVCLAIADGKELWRADFVKEFESPLPSFGFVCSPLLDESFVYVQAGNHFAKLDKKTGKVLWKTLKEGDAMMGSAFSSPVFAKLAGKEQIVVQTRTRLAGVDKATGSVLWEKKIPSFQGMNVLTPVVLGDSVFTSTYGGNTRLITASLDSADKGPAESWTLKYEGYMTTPVVIKDHAYLFGKDRRFICIDMKTGKERWRSDQRYGEYWNIVARNDKMLALDNSGKLLLIKANADKFELLDERQVSKAETWAHLAVVGDEVFIRDLFGLTAYRWGGK